MARLQILELPEGSGDDRPPFVLVIDQADDDLYADLAPTDTDGHEQSRNAHLAEQLGARAVLCFHGTIEIPANDTTAYLDAARGGLQADARYEVTIDGKPVEWTRADELHARAVDAVTRQPPQGPRPGQVVGPPPAADA